LVRRAEVFISQFLNFSIPQFCQDGPMRKLLLVVVAAVLLFLTVWFSGAKPEIRLEKPLKAIGAATPVLVRVSGKNGIREFRARVEQGGRSFGALEQRTWRRRWKFWTPREHVRQFSFVAGRKTLPGLEDGPARLILEAKSDDFRGATTTEAI